MPGAYSLSLDARLAAIEALDAASRGVLAPEEVHAAGIALQQHVRESADDDTCRAYTDFGALLEKFAHVVRWAAAVRSADVNPERYLRAATQGVRDLERRTNPPCSPAVLKAATEAILPVATVEQVEDAAKRLLCTPLPWPEFGVVAATRPPRANTEPAAESPPETGAVAFLTFRMNGAPIPEPHILQPNVLYDLELDATFSRWPDGVKRVRFSPLHVEPAGVVAAPTFEFGAPESSTGAARYLATTHGRLQISVPQDFLARPLEIRYAAFCETTDGADTPSEGVLSVQGQRRLVIQSFDPRLNPVTGVTAVDVRLLEVRQEARRHGLRDFELAKFLTLLGAAGRLAFKALADNIYPGTWSEARFQADVRSRLRDDPLIGSELEEHPAAAAGITDLSFHKIRLELKVDDSGVMTSETAVARFGQQTAQYVVGSDRRAGVLVVLDYAQKDQAPPSLENDMAVAALEPPGGGRPVLIGVVVVRGNLSRPSSLSR